MSTPAAHRLSREPSPYLQQHAGQPVEWYAWGEEALERARVEDKPILLSVGYAACHWCHVMAHESFDNPEIAALLNEHFVSIKVDREERPDLDQLYQNVAQVFARGGGWPLTVFLTPKLEPFFGGTYFPPEDRYGRPGFARVLLALAEAYRDKRADVESNAQGLLEAIRKMESITAYAAEDGAWDVESLRSGMQRLLQDVDWQWGGFGGAPKFPGVSSLLFLWRAGLRFDSEPARMAVRLSLSRMAEGGVFDQLGGGFHRYSVDERWAVPHFEKMLYDQGLALSLYAQVLLADGGQLSESEERLFVRVLEQTMSYLEREMRSPGGAFYSAQDADSEGSEGRFFVWRPEQIVEAGVRSPELVQAAFGVSEIGNFEDGATVLWRARSTADLSQTFGLPEAEVDALLDEAIVRLQQVRTARVAPTTDHKLMVSSNALVVSGLLWSAQALLHSGRVEQAARARRLALEAFDAVVQGAVSGSGGAVSLRTGLQTNSVGGFLDDYALLARAALDVVRLAPGARADAERLACDLTQSLLTRFRDAEGGGFYFAEAGAFGLIERPKSLFDQATPAGIAVALEVLAVGEESGWFEQWPESTAADARRALHESGRLQRELVQAPQGYGAMLCTGLTRALGVWVLKRSSNPATDVPSDASFIWSDAFGYVAGGEGRAQVCARSQCREVPTRVLAQLATDPHALSRWLAGAEAT